MAKDDAQPDVLRSTEATPIAKLSPAILDAESLVVEGVITVTWPYSVVTKSIAFILAERDPLHRRDKGQLRVEFHGAAGKALADSSLGGGDEVRLSLDGVQWEENQAWMRRPGILEWQMKFTNRLLLKIRRAESQEVDTINVDAADNEGDQESTEQLREMNASPSIEIEQTHFANPLPRTPLSVIPSKRFAYETLGPGEYASPAFLKRARVSYGSLFEGGFDIFDEEEPLKSAKTKKRKSRFSMNPTSWRYTSRSPTPVAEQPAEDEEQDEPKLDDAEIIMVEENEAKEAETGDQLPATQPQSTMVDHGCQTRELSSSPIRGVQIIAESKSTGILLQPTPTNPWKHVDMGHVLQEPSPLSFEYAAAHDAPFQVHESEPIRQPELHVSHIGFDMPMNIDPSLQSHEAETHQQQHHHQHTYDMMAPEMPPPRLQEHELHNTRSHDGLAWVAEALAPAYPTIPTHNVHDFPQGSFDRSSYTLRASPSDETHTLVSAGHHGMEMHGYVRVDEARNILSSSFEQSDEVKPHNSYPEHYEEDTETATVTATLGREGRSSPPQEDSSTDESEGEEEEQTQRGYHDWDGRWREGDPEEVYDDQQDSEQGSDEDDIDEEDDATESEAESGSEADYDSGSESESESQIYNEIAQPAPQVSRPFMPIPRPAPAAPKEPVVISLLSDSEDDGDDEPATVQAKKEPSEEPAYHEADDIDEQPSEQEDEIMDEDLDEHMDEAKEDKPDFEEAAEIRTVISRSSKRSSIISQIDGCDEYALHQHDEPNRGEIDHFEMDHPNLVLSPKSTRRQYVNITETMAETQDGPAIVSSPFGDNGSSGQNDFVAVNAANSEEVTNMEMRGTSKSRSPEHTNVEVPAVPEQIDEAPVTQQQQAQEREQEREREQRANSPGAVDSEVVDSGGPVAEPATEPLVHTPDTPTDMTGAVEAPILQSATNDDQLMEDVQSTGVEIEPPITEIEAEEVDVIEQDVEMQDDVLSQLREATENALKEESRQVDQAIAKIIVPETTGEPEVAAPSSPPATQATLSQTMAIAVPILEEQETTVDEQEVTKQLPTPLETQQDYHEVNHDEAEVVQTEVPLDTEEVNEAVNEDVDEDVDESVDEDVYEDEYEDAREDGGDDDDDFAIEQQLMSEFQHYTSPQKVRGAERIDPALSQPPETVEEIQESQQSQQTQHGEHCAHERSPRRVETEMLITLQSLRSHCRAKRLSSDSADSLSTDPSVLLARSSPTMAHRQCLVGDAEPLPQRSPRSSPRSKVEHSDPSVALAKSSPQESGSPKQTGVTASLRARRGVKGASDASILLAQAFSHPSERSPQQPGSPTASLRAGRRRTDKPDLSVQLAAASFNKGSQQQLEEEEGVQDAARDASANPRRDGTPESTATGHNLRSPRKPAGRPSSAASSVAEDGNIASLKLQLLRSLRASLPDCLPLKSLRTSLTKTADILAVATVTPRQPHRPKHGPRDYMLELNLTDPSVAPTGVNIAHIFRPHQASLPTVQAGDIVLLRRVQVVSMQGRGFGVRAGDASAWAVFEKDDEELLPQIKGPPVEVADEEIEYAQGLRRWWGLQDDKTLVKIDKANQRISQAGRDETK